jgi:hypothetical protein
MFNTSRNVLKNTFKNYPALNGVRRFYQTDINRIIDLRHNKYTDAIAFTSSAGGCGYMVGWCIGHNRETVEYNNKLYDKYEGRIPDEYYELYDNSYRHIITNFEKCVLGINGLAVGILVGYTYSISLPIGLSYILYKKVKRY